MTHISQAEQKQLDRQAARATAKEERYKAALITQEEDAKKRALEIDASRKELEELKVKNRLEAKKKARDKLKQEGV